MQFSYRLRKPKTLLIVIVTSIITVFILSGCSESTPPPVLPADKPPSITLFVVDTTMLTVNHYANIEFAAIDDNGIDSAVISYGDGGRGFFDIHGRKNLSAAVTRQYGTIGFFTTSLTVYDTKRQSDRRDVLVMVYPDSSRSLNSSSVKNFKEH